MKLTKTQSAQVSGTYQATTLDAKNKNVDFLLTGCNGKINTLQWKDGRNETVSDSRLARLQINNNWACNF